MRAMAAADAQLWWLSATVPNDQFLLYAFDGIPGDVEAAVGELRRNAANCAELRLGILDDSRWRYPRWVPCEVGAEQFAIYPSATPWQDCLDLVTRLPQLGGSRLPWRVHVLPRVHGIPRIGHPGAVVIVQIGHALGDGTRSAALAAALFGRQDPPRAVPAPDRGLLPWRAAVAARAHRRLERDVRAGVLDPPGGTRPALDINAGPRRSEAVRTLVLDRAELSGHTVTVGALVAVADALGGYLADRGADVTRLGAEVSMAVVGDQQAHNSFRNVGVDLYPGLPRPARAEAIAAQLAAHRRRGDHPAMRASTAAFAAVPAAILRWGVGRFDPQAQSATVAGHTVVSSVNRGPADLTFGGRGVVLTSGYPALSPMMGLTHGVHGIGSAVAVSVRADPDVVDVDEYLQRLGDSLGRRP